MDLAGFSADNVAFGQGGALLQQVNRDTMKFAMKCSAIGKRIKKLSGSYIDWQDVFKDPVTDHGKRSKRGLVSLWKCGTEYESSVEKPTRWIDNGFEWEQVLVEVFNGGYFAKEYTFDEVRANARK